MAACCNSSLLFSLFTNPILFDQCLLMTTQKYEACEKTNYYGLKRVVSILYY